MFRATYSPERRLALSRSLTGMLVGVSDERAVLGELLVAQFADVRRTTAGSISSRRHDLLDGGAVFLLGRLRRPPALSRATPARRDLLRRRRRRHHRLGVDVGAGGRRQTGVQGLERVRRHGGVR